MPPALIFILFTIFILSTAWADTETSTWYGPKSSNENVVDTSYCEASINSYWSGAASGFGNFFGVYGCGSIPSSCQGAYSDAYFSVTGYCSMPPGAGNGCPSGETQYYSVCSSNSDLNQSIIVKTSTVNCTTCSMSSWTLLSTGTVSYSSSNVSSLSPSETCLTPASWDSSGNCLSEIQATCQGFVNSPTPLTAAQCLSDFANNIAPAFMTSWQSMCPGQAPALYRFSFNNGAIYFDGAVSGMSSSACISLYQHPQLVCSGSSLSDFTDFLSLGSQSGTPFQTLSVSDTAGGGSSPGSSAYNPGAIYNSAGSISNSTSQGSLSNAVGSGTGSYNGVSWSGSGNTPMDYSTQIPYPSSPSYDLSDVHAPPQSSISNTIDGFISSNPLVSVIKGSSVTAVAGSPSVSGTVFGHTLTVDFSSVASYLQIFGNYFVVIAGIVAFFIMFL